MIWIHDVRLEPINFIHFNQTYLWCFHNCIFLFDKNCFALSHVFTSFCIFRYSKMKWGNKCVFCSFVVILTLIKKRHLLSISGITWLNKLLCIWHWTRGEELKNKCEQIWKSLFFFFCLSFVVAVRVMKWCRYKIFTSHQVGVNQFIYV